ncbi:MAG: IS3 family transposase [Clostridia bacterium]|nr:IS3 family transposase [Clostridia bacterium]
MRNFCFNSFQFCYYNNERISRKLKEMSPVQYRTHSQI